MADKFECISHLEVEIVHYVSMNLRSSLRLGEPASVESFRVHLSLNLFQVAPDIVDPNVCIVFKVEARFVASCRQYLPIAVLVPFGVVPGLHVGTLSSSISETARPVHIAEVVQSFITHVGVYFIKQLDRRP